MDEEQKRTVREAVMGDEPPLRDLGQIDPDEAYLRQLEKKARIGRLQRCMKDPAEQQALSELDARLTRQLEDETLELARAWTARERERKKERGHSSTRVHPGH